MPLDSRVKTKDTGSGVQAEGEVEDITGPGGKGFDAEVVMVIDSTHVKWNGYVSPTPFKKKTNGADIRFWWKAKFNPKKPKTFKVGLDCKKGANGPTPIALTAVSDAKTSPAKHRFSAAIDIFYHSPHCCKKPFTLKPIPWPGSRPKLRKDVKLKRKPKRKRER